MAFVEVPEKRGVNALCFKEGDKFKREFVLGTVLSNKGNLIDMTLNPRNDAVLDGWETVTAGWHLRLGKPNGKATDGWVGFGGREGQHWLYQRLVRVGYLHYPTRAWQDVGGAPSYSRVNLSHNAVGRDVGGVNINASSNISWMNIWNTPGAGEVYLKWVAEGKRLKEDIVLNQEAREWVVANRPPVTPVAQTYFGFVFQLDVSDIPKVIKEGVVQYLEGDFDDNDGTSKIEFKDSAENILGFFPISSATSEDGSSQIKLRKRIWKDGDGNVYLLVGAKVSDLNGLPAGDVVFDPTLDIQPNPTAGKDVHIRSDAPTSNWDGATSLELASTLRKALISFDLSSIPSDATCDSATYTVYSGGGGLNTHTMYSISAANSAWTETGATWNTRDGANNWAGSAGLGTPGTDYEASSLGSGTFNFNPAGTPTNFSLSTTRVKGWFGASNTNYGMLHVSSGGVDFIRSSDYAVDTSLRPKISVAYTEAVVVSTPAAQTPGGRRWRTRSEEEIPTYQGPVSRLVRLNMEIRSESPKKVSHAVTAAEFKKKVDNR